MNYYDDKFLKIAMPIVENKEFQKMKHIMHHDESVYEHVIDVAYQSYLIADKMGLDWEATIRGALLHDFYLYKFEKHLGIKIVKDVFRHATDHPKIALENAEKHFELNEMEKDIIEKHMFPFGGIPKYKESWIVSCVDKYLAVYEYSKRFGKSISTKYRKIYSFNK